VPVVSGALAQTGFAAGLWTVLLPVAGYAVWWWQRGPGRDSWRGAAGVAVWVLVGTSVFPLIWPLAVMAAIVVIGWERRLFAFGQWLIVIVAPALLLVGPWRTTLIAYPGRLFTGIEPTLGTTDVIPVWRIPLVSLFDGSVPPVWGSIAVMAVVWLAAIAGSIRRKRAAIYLCVAGVLALGVIGITRMLVWAPPGAWARPSGMELSILMVGVLLLGAVVGLDGMGADLRGRSVGLRHMGALGMTIIAVAALVLGTAWWAWQGEARLTRGPASVLPSYVLDVQQSTTPGRTLAISINGSDVSWSLTEGESPRLGQLERGLAFGADTQAHDLTDSVVGRLVTGSADDRLQADLQTLGIANIWVAGGGETVQMGIGNTPGLRTGTGRDTWMAWAVPDSAIAVIEEPDARTRTGSGDDIAAGAADRVLVLAEADDSRWVASLDGHPLARSSDQGTGQRFVLGAQGGVLDYRLDTGSVWWAWVQVGGLGLLILLALPGVRVRGRTSGPRRAARDAE